MQTIRKDASKDHPAAASAVRNIDHALSKAGEGLAQVAGERCRDFHFTTRGRFKFQFHQM
jgi:hypothetical protein